MKEFWLWVTIVTLIIICIMMLTLAAVHIEKRLNKADAMILRLEEKEKKRNEKPRIDPVDND